MATKRRTHQETQRQPQPTPADTAVEAAAADEPAPEGRATRHPDAPGPAAEPAAEPEASGAPQPGADGSAGATAESDADRQLSELASRLEEANSRHLRLAADFDNFKKRARQERMDTIRFAAATIAERLLTVVDDAERALNHAPEGIDENWLKGVRLTFQQLQQVLASVGVERIESVGATFDPNLHEAIGSEESGEYPEDTVVVELRPGYRMHERVLRPALVRVARPPA